MIHTTDRKPGMGMGVGAESAGAPIPVEAAQGQGQPQEQQVAIDGFNQVLEMLRIADPAFRESLLKRLAARDRELARSLRKDLGI